MNMPIDPYAIFNGCKLILYLMTLFVLFIILHTITQTGMLNIIKLKN